MSKAHILFILCCILPVYTEFADYMQVYEQECLGENRIHCQDGSCIWHHQYCDGKVDCPDGSDENACLDHTPDPLLCEESLHFLCSDKKRCIPRILLCNNETDCHDGSDERNCTDIAVDASKNSSCKGFTCASDGKCISSLWACDGTYDCDDRSDENPNTCFHTGFTHQGIFGLCNLGNMFIHLLPKEYQCLEGNNMCLKANHMCDGLVDCKDGSDEGDFCANWTTMCSNDPCNSQHSNATCFPERAGPLCMCPDYLTYNQSTRLCTPNNMCKEARPYCPQHCEDRGGPFMCDCEEGYHKDFLKIGHVCIAPDPEAMMFFSVRNEIKYLGLKSRKQVTVATGIKQAHGVSYDGQHLYWVETALGHQAIMRARLDNVAATKQAILGIGLEDPGDVAIDWLGGHLYLSDAQRGIISVCRTDGSLCTTLATNAKLPKFLTLHPANGMMYWADWHHKPVIMSAAMDGSGSAVLTDRLAMFAAGLTVDAPSQRLYFVDTTVRGLRLDNGAMFTLFNEPAHQPYAVSVFENSVYWSDWASNTVQATDKMAATPAGLLAALDSPVLGLHMYHPILQRARRNPCTHNPCSHFCLLASNETYTCACPDSMELGVHSSICQPRPDYRPRYVVVGGGATLSRVEYDTLASAEAALARADIGRLHAMAYDSRRDNLYIYDSQRKTINSLSMKDFTLGVTTVRVYRGLDDVVDMDYDYISDSLYVADAGRRFIEVISLRSGKRALLHRFDDEVPISLCVLPEHGKMLVAVSEGDQSSNIHIDSFWLDGSGRQHILLNNLKGPRIALKYSRHEDLVYLADESRSIIERMKPDGTGRTTYRELSTTVTSLAVTPTLVLWTDRRSSRLYWADARDDSTAVRRIELSIFPNTTYLHIQSTGDPGPVPEHPCQRSPCSDICVQAPAAQATLPGYTPATYSGNTGTTTPSSSSVSTEKTVSTGYKCLCPPGLLNVDGNCTKLVRCKEDQAFCHNSNVCIQKSALCDGKRDCFHGEDEEDCHVPKINSNSCGYNEMLCDGKCMDRNQVCVPSTTTTASPLCIGAQWACAGGGECVERAQLCDGVTDCPDGSDEAHALCSTFNCLHTEFMCSSGHCILKAFQCDGESDCYDDSDEINCYNKTCPVGSFRCRSGQCVELTRRCDGQYDCSDSSDEDDCVESDYIDTKEEIENCAEWEHTCELNRSICVPIGARCNGRAECPGGTDEAGCAARACGGGGYYCAAEQRCVPADRVCDGFKFCVDGADETPSACRTVNRTSVLYPAEPPSAAVAECPLGFRCASGACVEWRAACDGRPDCDDHSDEGGACAMACTNSSCSHTCRATARGPLCTCPAGRALGPDRATCRDVDECAADVCSQNCHNTDGSFLCSCHTGYALRSDRRSCKAVKGNMSVLYVTGNSVRSITADGLVATEFNGENIASITDMDYDVRRKRLYVTSSQSGELIEVNSTKDNVVISNIGKPTRVAVDWITGNVYFVDASPISFMRVCNVEKMRCAKMHKLPADAEVPALVIDPSSRRLFYCASRDLESVIWSASLSGHTVTQVAVVQNCTGLAVDTFKKRLYVAETGPSHIVVMDYDGNLFKQILADDPHLQAPRDLAIFEDHIYFLVANSFKLNRCLLFHTKRCELYLQRVFNANAFVLKHESVQRNDVSNVCAGVECDNVCVAGDSAPVCVCVDGRGGKDGKCPLVAKKEALPLFNGWTVQDYQKAHRVSVALITSVLVLILMYLAAFGYYHYVYKRKREREANYIPVHFHNSMAEGSTGDEGLTPIDTSAVQMPTAGSSRQEFVNPLQMFKNWRSSLRRQPRPIGTAGLSIEVPNLDVSDTESDLDEREHRQIVRRKNELNEIL